MRPVPRTDPFDQDQVLLEEFSHLHGAPGSHLEIDPDGPRQPREQIYDAIHRLPEPRAALCLSGGGVRSATFSLGVLQGLARQRELTRFHYLSTVSGGGYIGSWLTRWINEADGDADRVSAELAASRTRDGDAEAPALRHLRSFSSYLAPRRGVSMDTLTLVATYLRNLVLNWAVFLPLLAAVLMAPRLFIVSTTGLAWQTGAAHGVGFLGLVLALISVAIVARNLPSSNGDGRTSTTIARDLTLSLVMSAVCLSLWWGAVGPQTRTMVLEWSTYSGPWSGPAFALVVLMLLGVLIHALGALLGSCSRGGDITVSDALAVLLSGAFGGLILWIGITYLFPDPAKHMRAYALWCGPFLLGAHWLATVLYIGLYSRWASELDREWWGREGGLSLKCVALWVGLGWLVIYAPDLLLKAGSWLVAGVVTGGLLSGIGAALGGYASKAGTGDPSSEIATWRARLAQRILPVGATVFIVVLVIAISLLTSLFFARDDLRVRLKDMREHPAWPTARAQVDRLKRLSEYVETADRIAGKHITTELDSALVQQKRDLGREALSRVGTARSSWERRLKTFGATHRAAFGYAGAPRIALVWGSFGVLAAVGMGFAILMGPNCFSLHNAYGARLVRAYLGSSRSSRDPERFTGVDLRDNPRLADMLQTRAPRRLFHVINGALNLTRDTPLPWQQRQAASFTMSPLHAGSGVTRFQRSENYGDDKGLTLGRAMTISGAAVSPSMGYHSSAVVALVMTFFNIRLGWWLPNPGPEGRAVWKTAEPRLGFTQVVAGALGLAGVKSPYVYVSDGGHFDNLGLYEMVVRRCKRIVVVDASQDGESDYEDLARSLRLIRADLGIDITFPVASDAMQRRNPETRYTLARIRYSMVDGGRADEQDGVLVYVKPALLTGREAIDVAHFAAARARVGIDFPHESTADQFFDESQFESYRTLGRMAIEDLARTYPMIVDIPVPSEDALQDTTLLPPPLPPPAPPVRQIDRIPNWQTWGVPVAAGALAASAVLTVTGAVTLLTPNKLQVEALNVRALENALKKGLALAIDDAEKPDQPRRIDLKNGVPLSIKGLNGSAEPVDRKAGVPLTIADAPNGNALPVDRKTGVPLAIAEAPNGNLVQVDRVQGVPLTVRDGADRNGVRKGLSTVDLNRGIPLTVDSDGTRKKVSTVDLERGIPLTVDRDGTRKNASPVDLERGIPLTLDIDPKTAKARRVDLETGVPLTMDAVPGSGRRAVNEQRGVPLTLQSSQRPQPVNDREGIPLTVESSTTGHDPQKVNMETGIPLRLGIEIKRQDGQTRPPTPEQTILDEADAIIAIKKALLDRKDKDPYVDRLLDAIERLEGAVVDIGPRGNVQGGRVDR